MGRRRGKDQGPRPQGRGAEIGASAAPTMCPPTHPYSFLKWQNSLPPGRTCFLLSDSPGTKMPLGEVRKGLMRAWVFWKVLKRERPRVAAGRAGWPPRMRARLCPPPFGPPPRPNSPCTGGGGARSKVRRGTFEGVFSKVSFGEASGESYC